MNLLTMISLFACSVASVEAVTYDWAQPKDNSLQGWVNVLSDTTGITSSPGNAALSNPYEYTKIGTKLSAPEGLEADYRHNSLVVQSPPFQIGASAVSRITFDLQSGAGSGKLVSNFAAMPARSTAEGFLGMALMRCSDGAYLIFAHKSANSGTETFTWDAAALKAAVGTDLPSATYVLHLIDYKDSGWGHVETSKVELTTAQ